MSSSCSGSSARFKFEITRQDFLIFSSRYLCQSSDKSFHTWSSKSDRSSSYCCSLAFVEVRTQPPCGAFISFTETHPATWDRMLSICGLSPGLCRLLLFLVVLRPESHCPGRFVPACLFEFCSIFHRRSFVQIQILRFTALHHLPEFCHYELWTSSFLVESSDVFSQNTVQLLFHYIAFILGFVKVALHLFDQVLASSSSALLFRSTPSKSLIIPLSLSFFFSSVTAISTIFYNYASLFVLSLQLLFHVFDYAFTAFSTAFISAEISLC